jgi:sulfur carrier protein ThiS
MVKLFFRKKEFEVRPGMALIDALKKCEILPESIIAVRNGDVITEDEILRDEDVIKLISVISGG